MKEKLKHLIRRQNRIGRLLWLRYVYHLWWFYPTKRLYNFLYYIYLTKSRKCRPLKLESIISRGVFYTCLGGEGKGTSVLKIPHLRGYSSNALYKKLRCSEAFNEYSNMLLSLSDDTILGRHFPHVEKVRRDGGYCSSFVKGYNLIQVREMLLDGRGLASGLKASELTLAIDELLEGLRKYEAQNGQLWGDWSLQNLIYDTTARRITNVDLEGCYMYRQGKLEANMQYIEAMLNCLKAIVGIWQSQELEGMNILKVLSTVAYASKSDFSYSGKFYTAGYHSLALRGTYFRGQRECAARLAVVPYDFSKKVVLDLGCNCGGMLQCLADKILLGVGIDHNPKLINAANLIRGLNETYNLHFFTFDLENDDLSLIDRFVLGDRVDICFLLSICMWLKNWKKVIVCASMIADVVLFETNGDDGQQKDQVEFLRTCFDKVELINPESSDDLNKKERALYMCQNG